MGEARHFGLVLLLLAAVPLASLAARRVTGALRLPAPVLPLVAAAVLVQVVPSLHAPSAHTVDDLVTVALVAILFDGGVPGLLLGVLLTVVIRPVLLAPCLAGSGLGPGERGFVLLAGLKGAVPILLGGSILAADVPDARRLYGIVVVVVVFSVVVQGGLVPTLAGRLRVPMRTVEPHPWSVGVRLRDEPQDVHRLTVAAGSPADGLRIDELPTGVRVSAVVRDGRLLADETALAPGDQVLVVGGDDHAATFERPTPHRPGREG